MGLKDLFIKSDETTQKVSNEKTSTKFPDSKLSDTNFSFPQQTTQSFSQQTNQVSSEYLNKAIEVYQNGFNSLNQNGYDFYEFFQMIINGGINNPQSYPMAYAMGSAMDKSITKDKLLQQADFYLNEISKVYLDYVSKGNAKKQDVITQKNSENQALVSELNMFTQQMEALKTQIQDRQNKLNAIDGKYEPMIKEIENKLSANDIAKNQISQSIEEVKKGIITNLK